MKIVAKFGGTSMATSSSIQAVANILNRDTARTVCVVSAPGRTATDAKVTDLLMAGEYSAVEERFCRLATELLLGSVCLSFVSQQIRDSKLNSNASNRAYLGEYLSAYLLAKLTGRRFVDAREVIQFHGQHEVLVATPWLKDELVVVPGYYGYCLHTRQVRLFPRGGSDISGSYLAAATQADVYENWTDVSGVYCSDPQQNSAAKKYDYLTHAQMQSIASAGAQVFHPLEPLEKTGIPIVIKNTLDPESPGTIKLGSR
jgi:aspartate kinase